MYSQLEYADQSPTNASGGVTVDEGTFSELVSKIECDISQTPEDETPAAVQDPRPETTPIRLASIMLPQKTAAPARPKNRSYPNAS